MTEIFVRWRVGRVEEERERIHRRRKGKRESPWLWEWAQALPLMRHPLGICKLIPPSLVNGREPVETSRTDGNTWFGFGFVGGGARAENWKVGNDITLGGWKWNLHLSWIQRKRIVSERVQQQEQQGSSENTCSTVHVHFALCYDEKRSCTLALELPLLCSAGDVLGARGFGLFIPLRKWIHISCRHQRTRWIRSATHNFGDKKDFKLQPRLLIV